MVNFFVSNAVTLFLRVTLLARIVAGVGKRKMPNKTPQLTVDTPALSAPPVIGI